VNRAEASESIEVEVTSFNTEYLNVNPEYVKDLFRSIAGRYALANHLLSGGMDFWWRHRVATKIQQWNHLEETNTN
jgi:ubiquinone/menaquinone biosynthesis C-methylase UbiE